MFLIFTFHNTSFFMEQRQYTVDGSTTHTALWQAAHVHLSKRTHKIFLILFLKQNKEYFSEQIKLDTLSMSKENKNLTSHPLLTNMLLYRKDNSALDCLCRYDVYLSHLYISRRSKTRDFSPISLLTMYRNFNLFPFQPSGVSNAIRISPYWPFRTGFKIDSLLD